MPDAPIQTRTLSQLPELSAVSPEAYTMVEEEGGPTGKIPIRALLGRLIATDTAMSTEADLQAALDYDENAISLVFADPDPLRCGWYRKVGASGTGDWDFFEGLSPQMLAAVEARLVEVNAAVGEGVGAADEAKAARDEVNATKATIVGKAALTASAIADSMAVKLNPRFIANHQPPVTLTTAPADRLTLDGGGNLPVLEWSSDGRTNWFGGQHSEYPTFRTALQGTEVRGGLLIGPVPVVPDNVVKAPDPTYAGWAGFTGASTAVVDEELRITHPGGVNSAASVLIAAPARRALLVDFDGRRVSGQPAQAVAIPAWSHQDGSLLNNFATKGTFTNPTHVEMLVGTNAGQVHVGLKTNPASAAGVVHGIKNLRAREVVPFAGFGAGQFVVVASGVTPAAGVGLRSLWSAHIGLKRESVAVLWDAASHDVYMRIWSNNQERAMLLAGNVPPLTPLRTAALIGNRSMISLNGRKEVIVSQMAPPSVAYMGLGLGIDATEDWGTIYEDDVHRFAYWAGGISNAMLRFLAALDPILMIGDSFGASESGGGDNMGTLLEAGLGRPVVNIAVGGSTLTSQVDTYSYDYASTHDAPVIARNGGFNDATAESEQADYDRIDRLRRGRVWAATLPVVPPTCRKNGEWQPCGPGDVPDPTYPPFVQRGLLKAQAEAKYGAKIIDEVPYLMTLSNGSADDEAHKAAGYPPGSTLIDGVHESPEVRVGVEANVIRPRVQQLLAG